MSHVRSGEMAGDTGAMVTTVVRSPVKPAMRGMRKVSMASARLIAGRMVVSRRLRLHVPAARLRASTRWAYGRIGLPAEAVRAEICLIVGHNGPPR